MISIKLKVTPQYVFFGLLVVLSIFGIFWLCYTNGEYLNDVLPADFCFMDFFNHIFYVVAPENVYDVDYNACFPPLAYMFYWLISRMAPFEGLAFSDASTFTSYGILIFIIYNILTGIIFYDSLRKLLEIRGGEQKETAVSPVYISDLYF